MFCKIKKLSLLTATIGVGFGVVSARADSVANLDTQDNTNGTASTGWMVKRVAAVGPGPETESDTVFGTFGAEAITNPVTPPWVAAGSVGDGQAKWVSWNASAGVGYSGDVNGTSYVYTDTFTLTSGTSAAFLLNGVLSTDNALTGASIVDDTDSSVDPIALTITPNTPGTSYNSEYAYNYTFAASAGAPFYAPPTSHTYTLTLDVLNSYEGAEPKTGTEPGPTGMIFSGSADLAGGSVVTAVPLPASAGVGFSMLGAVGLLSVLRKKLTLKSRIA